MKRLNGTEHFLHVFRAGFSTIAQLVVTVVAHKHLAVISQFAAFMATKLFTLSYGEIVHREIVHREMLRLTGIVISEFARHCVRFVGRIGSF